MWTNVFCFPNDSGGRGIMSPVVTVPGGWHDGDFCGARRTASPDCMQRGEAEIAGVHRSEAYFLKTWVILHVGERALDDVGHPGRVVGARLEAIFINHTIE